MKLLLASSLLFSAVAAAATPWDIDPGHATANFSVRHMMVSDVHGSLGEVKGVVDFDEKDITKSKVEATIDVAGISTKNQKRDDHLRSPDFLEAAKFPAITFKSTKIEKGSGDALTVTGDLTIHGTTKSVTLKTTLSAEVANPFSKAITRGAVATTAISREAFGLVWNMPLANGVLVGDEIKIELEFELIKRAPKPATK